MADVRSANALSSSSISCESESPSLRRNNAISSMLVVENVFRHLSSRCCCDAHVIGTLFCACGPRPRCHLEIDMSDAHTKPPSNLTVDGITINLPSLPEAVSSIVSAAQDGNNFSFCTLNLDHVVQLRRRSDFREAYRRARFVTADGFPIVVLSRLMGTPIRRTTGADL